MSFCCTACTVSLKVPYGLPDLIQKKQQPNLCSACKKKTANCVKCFILSSWNSFCTTSHKYGVCQKENLQKQLMELYLVNRNVVVCQWFILYLVCYLKKISIDLFIKGTGAHICRVHAIPWGQILIGNPSPLYFLKYYVCKRKKKRLPNLSFQKKTRKRLSVYRHFSTNFSIKHISKMKNQEKRTPYYNFGIKRKHALCCPCIVQIQNHT